MIEIEGLLFRYPDDGFALEIAELQLPPKSTTALVGPSGCGKTTLLNLIAGIEIPEQGRVRVDGVEVSTLPEDARRAFRVSRIGLVFQEFELLDYLTVIDNMLLPYQIGAGLDLDETVRSRARQLAAEVGLTDKLDRHPRQLSQGERQRVAVCRAMVPQPLLVLADEPTGNLDPANKQKVVASLIEHAAAAEATLLVVTHDRAVVERFDRVLDVEELTGKERGAQT